jgi:hypothetical protein
VILQMGIGFIAGVSLSMSLCVRVPAFPSYQPRISDRYPHLFFLIDAARTSRIFAALAGEKADAAPPPSFRIHDSFLPCPAPSIAAPFCITQTHARYGRGVALPSIIARSLVMHDGTGHAFDVPPEIVHLNEQSNRTRRWQQQKQARQFGDRLLAAGTDTKRTRRDGNTALGCRG